MVYRIYVEKKPGFDGEANGLKNELTGLLGIRSLTGLRLLNRRGCCPKFDLFIEQTKDIWKDMLDIRKRFEDETGIPVLFSLFYLFHVC